MRELRRLIITWLATARGGAEQSSYDLCAALAKRYQLEVTLLLWQHHTDFPVEMPEGFRLSLCHDVETYRQTLSSLLTHESATILFSNHRTFQIDLSLARQAGVRCGVVFRETPLPDEALRTIETPDSPRLVYRRGAELDWAGLHQAAALVGVSNFCARQINRFAPEHPFVLSIYNGLGHDFFPALHQAEIQRRFLIVSRLIGWKAIDFAIEIFARLWQRYPDARLQIAGEGEEDARLRQQAARLLPAGVITFLGFQKNIRQVYQQNDFLFHPSPIESFGRVIAEAGACGLPAIVSQSAGAGELIIHGHTGLTFQASNADDCLRALAQACQMRPDVYDRLAQNAFQRVQALFHLERTAEEYVGLANLMLQENSEINQFEVR